MTSDPDIAWHDGGTTADVALTQHLTAWLGADPGQVRVGRLCPACGSDRHGRPWARHETAGAPHTREVHVSLARAEGYVVTALSLRGPLGVDAEAVADVARRWTPGLVLAPGETARTTTDRARAWCWAAKEAVLKRRGTGLKTPMTEVRLAEETGVRDLPAPTGLVAVLAAPT